MRTLLLSLLFLPLASGGAANAVGLTACEVQGNPKKSANAQLVKAKLAMAGKLYENGNYSKAYSYVKDALRLSPQNETALQLKQQCEEALENIRQRAIAEYNDAVESETPEALQQFINTYPNSNLAKQARSRLQELKVWQQCKAKNTKEAYNAYLKQSQLQAYADDARQAISRIEEEERRAAHLQEAKERYAQVIQSNSLSEVEQFQKDYADTEYAEKIATYISLLKGRQAFEQQDLTSAFSFYAPAKEQIPEQFTPADLQQYAQAKEYCDYKALEGSTSEESLQQFLDTYGKTSAYYAPISDKIALLKVNNLNAYTYTSDDLAQVRSYVQTESTSQEVQRIVSGLESVRTAYEKEQRALARKRWWKGRVTVGWHVSSIDYMDEHLSWMTGLRLRAGRYTDCVNFLINCDLNNTWVQDPDYKHSNSSESDSRFEDLASYVEPSFGLRFNMGKRSKKARFFIGAHIVKGFKIIEEEKDEKKQRSSNDNLREGTLSIMPELGWSGRKFDFSIYYKYYFKNNTLYKEPNNSSSFTSKDVNENYGNNRVGVSATWFF